MRIDLIDRLAREGKVFTFADAQRILGTDPFVTKVTLSRLEKKEWIERVEKGKYTLHEFVIASLLVKPCVIAYWSALHFYGLTEQIPNVVFIQTSARKKKQKLKALGIDYQIVRVKKEKIFGLRKEWIEDMQINITDREKTIIDCLDKPMYCGGVVEVAKALKKNKFNETILFEYASRIKNSGVIRRLGYLCEIFGIPIDLPRLKTRNYLYLDPTMSKKGSKNSKWKLIVNLDEKMLGELE